MIWTPMPLELVFEDTTVTRQVREQALADGSALVVDLTGGAERVLRLDATDPQLYLLPEFSPGGLVSSQVLPLQTPGRPRRGA